MTAAQQTAEIMWNSIKTNDFIPPLENLTVTLKA